MGEPRRIEGNTIPDPRKIAGWLLAVAVLTTCFADYWAYSAAFRQDRSIYSDTLQGTALAPAQYRIGVVMLADFLARHSHLALRHTLALIDTGAALVAAFTLFFLLRRSVAYRRADAIRRWFAAGAFLVLVQFYLVWVVWYQRPETLPSAALVALTLLLLTVRPSLPPTAAYLVTGCGMVALAAVQGLVRADVAVAFHAGILLVCMTRAGEGLSLPRGMQAMVSIVAMLVAGGIQFYLMQVRYPQATYGGEPVFRLLLSLTSPDEWPAFLLFIVPYAWTVRAWLRSRNRRCGPDAAILCGSVAYFVLWAVLGRIKEVRIFLPFALAVVPLTVALAMEQFVPERVTAEPGDEPAEYQANAPCASDWPSPDQRAECR